MTMLLRGGTVIDGTGAPPYPAEVLVQGNRISRVTRGARTAALSGVMVIDTADHRIEAPHVNEVHARLLGVEIEVDPPDREQIKSKRGATGVAQHGTSLNISASFMA